MPTSKRRIRSRIIALRPPHEKGDIRIGRAGKGLGLSFCLLAGLACGPLQATPDRELRAHEQQLKNLQQHIKAIDQELQEDRALHSRESRKLRETEQEISDRLSALRQLGQQIDSRGAETRELQTRQQAAVKQLTRQRELLIAQMRASYLNGRQEKVKLMLNQGDPAQVGRMLGYHDYLAQARSERIQQVREQTQALLELEAALKQQLEGLQTLREIQAAQLAQLEAARADRQDQVSKLEAEISASGNALQRMQSEQSALQSLVASIRLRLSDIPAEFRNSPPLSKAEGKLPWPLEGPLLARFGQAKLGTSLQWDGIWIEAKAGTPVRAVAAGRVVYVGRLHRYGLLIISEHKDGYYSLYGHNQEARVEVGETVKPGQILGYAGDSGGHGQTGLYFELRQGKTPVNPMRWLTRH